MKTSSSAETGGIGKPDCPHCGGLGYVVAAVGPFILGRLASDVYGGFTAPLPLRYASVTMCAVFLIGLFALPFAPETKDQPLPE